MPLPNGPRGCRAAAQPFPRITGATGRQEEEGKGAGDANKDTATSPGRGAAGGPAASARSPRSGPDPSPRLQPSRPGKATFSSGQNASVRPKSRRHRHAAAPPFPDLAPPLALPRWLQGPSAGAKAVESKGAEAAAAGGRPGSKDHTATNSSGPEQPPRPPPPQQQPAAKGKSQHQQAPVVIDMNVIPHLPMVLKGDRWFRANVVRERGDKVLVDFPGYEATHGAEWLDRTSERIWRGSYKGKDWKHLGGGAWAPKASAIYTVPGAAAPVAAPAPAKAKSKAPRRTKVASDADSGAEASAEDPEKEAQEAEPAGRAAQEGPGASTAGRAAAAADTDEKDKEEEEEKGARLSSRPEDAPEHRTAPTAQPSGPPGPEAHGDGPDGGSPPPAVAGVDTEPHGDTNEAGSSYLWPNLGPFEAFALLPPLGAAAEAAACS